MTSAGSSRSCNSLNHAVRLVRSGPLPSSIAPLIGCTISLSGLLIPVPVPLLSLLLPRTLFTRLVFLDAGRFGRGVLGHISFLFASRHTRIWLGVARIQNSSLVYSQSKIHYSKLNT
ncbi:hypothetical protein SAMN04488036_104276 [Shimia haliotis]|uniref:Uncharacterized protein n=1 Tax=Shimia haliotis TaxID=1280847 RepID=A0A1I4EGC2_9RHOB|nr:hypothetical protein SAMN04488036_104276 [Shimia haliotis]